MCISTPLKLFNLDLLEYFYLIVFALYHGLLLLSSFMYICINGSPWTTTPTGFYNYNLYLYITKSTEDSVQVNTVPQRQGEQTSPDPQTYNSYVDFISNNPKAGKLRVQTYAASQVFPIQNARVLVEKEFTDGKYTFAEEYTDTDGVADEIILPTKNKSLSLSPGTTIPYSTYTVKVSHPQFSPVTFHNVPIFESIESLQPVAMQPLSRPAVYEDVYEDAPNL